MSLQECQIELLTKDELSEIIKLSFVKQKNVQLIDFKIFHASKDIIGFLGDYLQLKIWIKSDESNMESKVFFIKTLPLYRSEERKQLESSGIFKKEAMLYRTLLKDIELYSQNKWKPDCYLARDDLLVLEDLYAINYKQITKDMSIEQIKLVLTTLATIHAASISFEVNTSEDIGIKYKEYLFETSIDEQIDWYITGLVSLKEIATAYSVFQNFKNQEFIAKNFINILKKTKSMTSRSTKYRNVLCHRDIWGKNIFLNSTNSILVDYQTSKYCPPAIDVLLLIYLNTRRNYRKKNLNGLLEYYYQQLSVKLSEQQIKIDQHITWIDFINSCSDLQLFVVMYNAIVVSITQIPDEIMQNIKNEDPERYLYYKEQNRTSLIIFSLENNKFYKEYLLETVEELIEAISEYQLQS